MKNTIDIFINHEKKIIDWSNFVLKMVKTFSADNNATRNKIDECSDVLNKTIASCETFLDILNNTTSEDEDKLGAKTL